MAVPKRKTSKSRRDKRRTHKKTTAVQAQTCPKCSEAVLPHRACNKCGYYKNREAIKVKNK